MKLSGAVATTSIVVVLAGLVGLVWFELPKGQRANRAVKLHTLAPYERSAPERATQLAAPSARVAPAPIAAPKSEVVDLRASAPGSTAAESAATAPQTPLDSDHTLAESAPGVPSSDAAASEPEQAAASSAEAAAPQPALTVWMRDAEGAPLSAGNVRARWREAGELRERTAVADERGLATFDAALGEGAVLEARAPGCAPASFGPLSSAQCAGAELGLTLERGAKLSGVVRNARNANPLTVVVWPAGNQGLALAFECEFDADARFAIDGVWNGPLEALALDGEGSVSAVQSTDGAGDELTFALEQTAPRAGVVLDPNGRELAGACVEAWVAHDGFAVARIAATHTDVSGRFELPYCADAGLIQVHAADGATRWIDSEGEDPLQVQLTARRSLRVHLSGLDSPSGEWSLSGWGIEDIASQVFDGADLELRDLAPGPYSFALRGPDGATRHFTYVLTSDGDHALELRLR